MQVSVADTGTLRKQVTITFDAAEVSSRESTLLQRYAGRMSVKGFRNGKVPPKLVKQRFGEAVRGEVQEALSNEGLQQAMREHDLRPIGPLEPETNEISDQGLTLIASFDVQPPLELPDPKSIDLPVEDTSASEQEVQAELDGIARRSGEHADVPEGETLAKDDAVTLSGKLTAGEETVRDIQDLNHLVGAYPLFGKEPDEVVAMVSQRKVGDVLEFDTTLPQSFKPEAWAGKDVHVAVTIQRAQRMTPAPLDDDFAKKLGTESLEQLTERVQQMLASRKEQELHGKRMEAMIDQPVEQTSFELPPKLFADLVDQRTQAELERAKQGEEAVDEAAIRETQQAAIERELRQHLLTEAIANTYEVRATQQDLQQQISMAAYQSGRQPQDVAKQLQESGQMMQVMSDIRSHKALETMLAKILEAHGIGAAAEAGASADTPEDAGATS
jgi:trigger factor